MQIEEVLDCAYSERKKSHHDPGMRFSEFMKGPQSLEKALASENTDNSKKAIYIHVPYCKKICSFCNMRRNIKPAPNDYADFVIKQIENYGKTKYVQSSTINSIYFGGGTPTALNSKDLQNILQALYKNFNIAKDAEISLETTITELNDDEKIKTLYENKVNRLSIGVQTFDTNGRKELGRFGDGKYAEEFIQKLFTNGFENVNIDIIYNYPNETKEILQQDLRRAFALNIAGFSFYSLIVMDKTKLGKKLDTTNFNKNTINCDAEFFLAALEESKKAGYDFLEITKLVKANRDNYEYIRVSHNAGDVFPIGAGAGGSVNSTAIMIPLEREKFIHSTENFDNLMGMAIDPAYKRIKRFSGQLQEGNIETSLLFEEELQKLNPKLEILKAGNLVILNENTQKFKFTHKGFFWGNSIASDLVKSIFS